MVEKGLYYATSDFSQLIKKTGGTWNDTKHRPIVCLIKSQEDNNLYWAIPMGKLNHRDAKQKERLDKLKKAEPKILQILPYISTLLFPSKT